MNPDENQRPSAESEQPSFESRDGPGGLRKWSWRFGWYGAADRHGPDGLPERHHRAIHAVMNDAHAREKAALFQEKLNIIAPFHVGPLKWWHENRDRLRVPTNVEYVGMCIDEGADPDAIPGFTMHRHMDTIALPGSGITLDAVSPTTGRERELIRAAFRGRCVGICNHCLCAACQGIAETDDGREFARRLAMDLNGTARYLGQIDRLARPEKWHTAVGSVLRYTPMYRSPFSRKDATAFETAMWVFNGRGHEHRRIKLIRLPIRIAFGAHGNGALFTPEHRFLIPYVFDPKSVSRESIEEEILEAAQQEHVQDLVEPIALAA